MDWAYDDPPLFLQGKLDQRNRSLEVATVVGRDVSPSDLAEVAGGLASWLEASDDMLAALGARVKVREGEGGGVFWQQRAGGSSHAILAALCRCLHRAMSLRHDWGVRAQKGPALFLTGLVKGHYRSCLRRAMSLALG